MKDILNLQGACGTSVLGKINAQQRTFTSDVLKIAEKHSLVSGINIAKNSSLFAAIQPAPLISDTLMRSLRVQSPLANLDFAPQVRLIEQQANFKLPDYGAVLSVMPLSWGKSLMPDMTMFNFGETSLFANAQAIFQQSLGDPLGGWTRDLFESTRSVVRAFARIGLEAALRARHAVLSGDTAEVDYFIKEWLEQEGEATRRRVRGFVRMQQKRDQAAREFRAAHESY